MQNCNLNLENLSKLINFMNKIDLSGSQDGSVRLWEYSHAQPVAVPRPPGTFAKVTRIRFHGNKFGVSDGMTVKNLTGPKHNSNLFYFYL